MKKHLSAIAMAFLLTGSNPADGDDVKAELKSLQGTWKVVRAEREGKDVREQLGYEEYVIEANSSQVRYKGVVRKSRFEIDPTKTPKEITFTTSKGDEVRGVYELKGDTWKVLLSQVSEERPKSLKDVGLFYEYERVKPK